MTCKTQKPTPFPKLWYASRLRKAAELESTRVESVNRLDEALNVFQKKYQWKEVYIFGSITKKGSYGPTSDVDIAVEGLNKLDFYKFVGDISAFLEKRVDVIILEECHFAASIKQKGIKWSPKIKS